MSCLQRVCTQNISCPHITHYLTPPTNIRETSTVWYQIRSVCTCVSSMIILFPSMIYSFLLFFHTPILILCLIVLFQLREKWNTAAKGTDTPAAVTSMEYLFIHKACFREHRLAPLFNRYADNPVLRQLGPGTYCSQDIAALEHPGPNWNSSRQKWRLLLLIDKEK